MVKQSPQAVGLLYSRSPLSSIMSNYDNFFYPLMLIFNIAPIFEIRNSKHKFLNVFYFCFNFVRFCIFILCLVAFCISMYILFGKHRLDNLGIFSLLIASGSCQGTISVLFLWHWARQGYLRKFVELIKMNQDEKPFNKNSLKPLFKIRNIIICGFCFFLISMTVYLCVMTLNINSKSKTTASLFGTENNGFDHWFRKILLWGGYFQSMYFLLCLTIFLIFAFVLIHEFECVLSMFASKLIFDYQYLKFVYSCHVNVCKVLNLFNVIFKRFIFICYATNVPFLIMILYSIVKIGGRYDNLLVIIVNVKFYILIILQLIILSLIPATINQKVCSNFFLKITLFKLINDKSKFGIDLNIIKFSHLFLGSQTFNRFV